MLKTGFIQPETIPGHFPRNLRTIVELYRSCLDAGAELVLCPPLALSGVHTGELALRSGFRTQHRAALAYLAREIADVPLLLAAADADGSRFHMLRNGLSFPRQAVISPAAHGTVAVPVFGRGFAGGRNKKTPLRVFMMLVAGAGFEPTTFGL